MSKKNSGTSDQSVTAVSSLYSATLKLNETHDLTTILENLNTILSETCRFDAIFFYLCSEQDGSVKLAARHSKTCGRCTSCGSPDEIMLWILEHRTMRIVPVTPQCGPSDHATCIILPLISTHHIIGFIQLVLPVAADQIDDQQKQMLWIVASYAASLLHNAHLIQKLEQNNDTLNKIEQYLTNVLDNMIYGIMVVESDGTINLLSKTMEIIFHLPDQDSTGQHFRTVFPAPIVRFFDTIMSDIADGLIVIDREFEYTTDKTAKVRISTTASPLQINNTETGIIFLVKSISNSNDLITLAELDKLKSNFVATVSHEFKTPLNLILGSTNLLQEGLVGSLNEKQLKLVKLIRDGSNRLMVLTNSLLDLAKLEAGKGQLNLEALSLKTLVNMTVTRFQHIIKEHAITLNIHFNDGIDQIIADHEKLAQMMHHVISNAVKYNNPGGSVEITVGSWAKDHTEKFIAITITDNGIGIIDEEQQDVFNEFYRVDDPQVLEREGIGLGLTIARRVIDLHRGKIAIQSYPNQGTEITIILPRDPRIL